MIVSGCKTDKQPRTEWFASCIFWYVVNSLEVNNTIELKTAITQIDIFMLDDILIIKVSG